MNDKAPTPLDRLLDQVPVGQAPISHLLAAGHTAKRRQRRTLLGGVAAATVLVLGGGTIATQALSGSNGQSDNPVADRSPGTVSDLQVRVESGVAQEVGVLADDMSSAEVALWDTDSQSVIYVSDYAYSSSCPPTASAHVATDGGLTLKIRDYDGPDDCTDDAGRVTVFMDGLTQAPATLTIDDKDETRTLPITNNPAPSFDCPAGTRARMTMYDRSQPPAGVTLEDLVSRIPSAVIQERSATKAVAVVTIDGALTSKTEFNVWPNGSWAISSETSCVG